MTVNGLREYALAFAWGKDAAEAFEEGHYGHGLPFYASSASCSTPLLRHCFEHVPPHMMTADEQRVWLTSFFQEHRRWEHADTSGLAERFYDWLPKKRSSHPSSPDMLDMLLFASLPGPHECPISPDAYLGEPRWLTIPATKAIAILRMRDLPDGTMGCIEVVPTPTGTQGREFLFFGMRSVK